MNASNTGVVGGTGGCSSPGWGERLIAHREHEVLGQPDRLVAEALGFVGRVDDGTAG